MHNLKSTKEIIANAEYISDSKNFFKKFNAAYEVCRSQVLKLETRQSYDESGDESFELLKAGKLKEAVQILRSEKNPNTDRFKDLKFRKIDFIRCRPVIFPITDYLKWEFVAYQSNMRLGEQIFCLEENSNTTLFSSLALHDFMVFDNKKAFVHDYDLHGKIQGGWIVDNKEGVTNLIFLYALIRVECINFKVFLKNYKIVLPR